MDLSLADMKGFLIDVDYGTNPGLVVQCVPVKAGAVGITAIAGLNGRITAFHYPVG